MANIFTYRERTEKNKTIGQALTAAEAILKQKGYTQTCTNALQGRELTQAIVDGRNEQLDSSHRRRHHFPRRRLDLNHD